MILTVGKLRQKLEDIPDSTEVYIERIHDVYFEKYNWKTEELIFQRDIEGTVIDSADILLASSASNSSKGFAIYAHI